MNIAVVIVHNKTDLENAAQITAILPFVTKITDVIPDFDDQGNQIGTHEVYHYEINGLNIPHQVKFYQIIPYGVTLPSNLYSLDSHKVFYGKGDEDKTSDHPRFFNWGLKRGTDYGADVVVYLDQVLQLSASKLRTGLGKLKNNVEFIEETFGKIGTLKLLKEVGQLKEDRSLTQAFTEYKGRIIQKGLQHG